MSVCITLLLTKNLVHVLSQVPRRSEFIRAGLAYGLDQGWRTLRRRANGLQGEYTQTSLMIPLDLRKRLALKAKRHLVAAFAQHVLSRYIFVALEGAALALAKEYLPQEWKEFQATFGDIQQKAA